MLSSCICNINSTSTRLGRYNGLGSCNNRQRTRLQWQMLVLQTIWVATVSNCKIKQDLKELLWFEQQLPFVLFQSPIWWLQPLWAKALIYHHKNIIFNNTMSHPCCSISLLELNLPLTISRITTIETGFIKQTIISIIFMKIRLIRTMCSGTTPPSDRRRWKPTWASRLKQANRFLKQPTCLQQERN